MTAAETPTRVGHVPIVSTWTCAAVAAVGAGTTAVLASRRIGRSYHYDEAVTIVEFVASGSPIHAFTNQIVVNNHPLFAAIQAVVWRLGATTEATQRITPILFGALAVGLLGWAVTRRLGVVAGCAAVVVTGLLPLFIAQTRQIRGYSLAVLAVTLALVALVRWLRDGERTWLAVHGIAAVVAVTTHPYSAVAFVILAAGVTGAGRLDRRLVVTWIASALAAVTMLVPILGQTLEASSERGRRFRSGFPIDLIQTLLGPGRIAMVITGMLLIAGVIALVRRSAAMRRGVIAAAITATVSIGGIWAVLRPFDLYPRFLITLVPLLAVVAAIGARAIGVRLGTAAVVVLALASIPAVRSEVTFEPGIHDAAVVVTATREAGLEPCGRNILPLRVYTEPPRLVRSADDLDGCDVVVLLGSTPAGLRDAATHRFGETWQIRGGITVHSDVPRTQLIGTG